MDCSNHIAVVHNGIIENYAELKHQLISRGHIFRSETDTEVVAHLIEEAYESEIDLLSAVQNVVPKLTGSYALLVIAIGEDRIIAARYASPLVLGVGDGEFFAASDMMPILDHTERAMYLEDGDIASISQENAEIDKLVTGRHQKRRIPALYAQRDLRAATGILQFCQGHHRGNTS
jgi:glucosamine--fructose-6-phosphate aminotransferase (isomerizing)